MDVLWLLLIVLFLATLNETLIEFLFGEILAKFAPKVSWVLKYIAVVSAVVMVFCKSPEILIPPINAESSSSCTALNTVAFLLWSSRALGEFSVAKVAPTFLSIVAALYSFKN